MRLMKLNLILSTDLLSRGVDLPDVKLVINFDMPLTLPEFFHRIGRAGRFGSKGSAFSMITDKEKQALPYIERELI
jgi:superfamily II DNA/RNA helicase